jgi:hypothetical protein
LTALKCACHPEIAAATKGYRTLIERFRFLTGFLRIDTVQVGKELVGENRGVDRILRGLKLHAEGRQFGDPNS